MSEKRAFDPTRRGVDTGGDAPSSSSVRPVSAPASTSGPAPADDTRATAAMIPDPDTCPHCGGALVAHTVTTGPKAGAAHCDTCGCCLIGGAVRPGHPACDQA